MDSRSTWARNAAVVVVLVLQAVAVATGRAAASAQADVARGFESVDFGRLAALADELRADVRARSADGGPAAARARVRTTSVAGPAAAAGCGFAFLVNDDAGQSSHVPRFERATCAVHDGRDGPRVHQSVQFVRPDAVYEAAVTARAAVDNVTFTSNGGDGLEIDTLCLGFGGGGGAQAFCVDRRLLDACARGDVFLGPGGGIRLSRAFAGRAAPSCKEIVFRDVGGLARGFESLARGDAADGGGARTAVCSRIGLLAETSAWAYDAAKCYAQREDATAGGFYYVKVAADRLRDRCTRVTDGVAKTSD